MIQAGRLRERLQVQSLMEVQSSTGVVSRTWSTADTRWGNVRLLSAQEAEMHGQQEASEVYEITMRPYSGLTPDMRINDGIPNGYLKFNGISYGIATKFEEDPMIRASNGDGNAWSVSFWIWPKTSGSGTILYYGRFDAGAVSITYNDSTVELKYGEQTANLTLGATLQLNKWNHVLITFDGGTTGDSQDVGDYYSRFAFYVDGEVVTTQNSNVNNGYTGPIDLVGYYHIGATPGLLPSNFLSAGTRLAHLAVYDSVKDVDDLYRRQWIDLTSTSPYNYIDFQDYTSVNTFTDSVGSQSFTSTDLVRRDWKAPKGIYQIRSINNDSFRNHVYRLICTREL